MPDRPAADDDRLLSWPARLAVFAVLFLIALLAIGVIDRHVMAKTQPLPAVCDR